MVTKLIVLCEERTFIDLLQNVTCHSWLFIEMIANQRERFTEEIILPVDRNT